MDLSTRHAPATSGHRVGPARRRMRSVLHFDASEYTAAAARVASPAGSELPRSRRRVSSEAEVGPNPTLTLVANSSRAVGDAGFPSPACPILPKLQPAGRRPEFATSVNIDTVGEFVGAVRD